MTGLLTTVLLGTAIVAERPNIILMMADDMGMGDSSVYQDFTGNSNEVQLYTPNMDRLQRSATVLYDAGSSWVRKLMQTPSYSARVEPICRANA